MKITLQRVKNLSFLVVDDFFTAKELQAVEREVKDLKRFLLSGLNTGVSTAENNIPQKTGRGVFLDPLYLENREASAILEGNRKLFSAEFIQTAENFDASFGAIRESNHDSTLLNYYVSGQEYKAHRDGSRVSAVTFLREGNFTGGGFRFPSQGVDIEAVHNRTVVFPGCVLHQALPVHGDGARISIAQFINFIEE
tara:strand:- start:125 stop:712 length:588 start_codon:yes stop_codon:yes gene_type:complete